MPTAVHSDARGGSDTERVVLFNTPPFFFMPSSPTLLFFGTSASPANDMSTPTKAMRRLKAQRAAEAELRRAAFNPAADEDTGDTDATPTESARSLAHPPTEQPTANGFMATKNPRRTPPQLRIDRLLA